MKAARMGRVQLRIMQVLWANGRASAREITDALNEEEPIAHSTVQTLLRKLEEKGSVAHDAQDRTFLFYPLVEEDHVTRDATRDLIERVFAGSVAGLVSYLVREERIPRKELEQIRKLIDEKTIK